MGKKRRARKVTGRTYIAVGARKRKTKRI